MAQQNEQVASASGPQIVNGVRVDTLLAQPERTVFSPIPKVERGMYLLRGANVGRFALNLMLGLDRVNPFDDLFMHVSVNGDYIVPWSEAFNGSDNFSMMSPPPLSQVGPEAVEQWRQLTGSAPHHFPGIVFGIPRDPYESRLVLHPQTYHPVVGEIVPFRHIDPYSQELLGKLFEIDLSVH